MGVAFAITAIDDFYFKKEKTKTPGLEKIYTALKKIFNDNKIYLGKKDPITAAGGVDFYLMCLEKIYKDLENNKKITDLSNYFFIVKDISNIFFKLKKDMLDLLQSTIYETEVKFLGEIIQWIDHLYIYAVQKIPTKEIANLLKLQFKNTEFEIKNSDVREFLETNKIAKNGNDAITPGEIYQFINSKKYSILSDEFEFRKTHLESLPIELLELMALNQIKTWENADYDVQINSLNAGNNPTYSIKILNDFFIMRIYPYLDDESFNTTHSHRIKILAQLGFVANTLIGKIFIDKKIYGTNGQTIGQLEVSEYYPMGNLRNKIQLLQKELETADVARYEIIREEIYRLAFSVIDAIDLLIKMGVAFPDIKPENLFLYQEKNHPHIEIRFPDYKTMISLTNNPSIKDGATSFKELIRISGVSDHFLPPEINQELNPPCDLLKIMGYEVGMVLFELTGNSEFRKVDKVDLRKKNHIYPKPDPNNKLFQNATGKELYNIIDSLLGAPEQRMNLYDAAEKLGKAIGGLRPSSSKHLSRTGSVGGFPSFYNSPPGSPRTPTGSPIAPLFKATKK